MFGCATILKYVFFSLGIRLALNEQKKMEMKTELLFMKLMLQLFNCCNAKQYGNNNERSIKITLGDVSSKRYEKKLNEWQTKVLFMFCGNYGHLIFVFVDVDMFVWSASRTQLQLYRPRHAVKYAKKFRAGGGKR